MLISLTSPRALILTPKCGMTAISRAAQSTGNWMSIDNPGNRRVGQVVRHPWMRLASLFTALIPNHQPREWTQFIDWVFENPNDVHVRPQYQRPVDDVFYLDLVGDGQVLRNAGYPIGRVNRWNASFHPVDSATLIYTHRYRELLDFYRIDFDEFYS